MVTGETSPNQELVFKGIAFIVQVILFAFVVVHLGENTCEKVFDSQEKKWFILRQVFTHFNFGVN